MAPACSGMIYITAFIHADMDDYLSENVVLQFNTSSDVLCVDITIVDDTTVENTEMFQVMLTDIPPETSVDTTTVTIMDDDGVNGMLLKLLHDGDVVSGYIIVAMKF